MKVSKSKSHSKHVHDFACALIIYFLSKHGYAASLSDDPRLDIKATHLGSKRAFGIVVASRTRKPGQEAFPIRVMRDRIENCRLACRDLRFGSRYALVTDRGSSISGFLVSEATLLRHAPLRTSSSFWHVKPAYLERYRSDGMVVHFELPISIENWSALNA